MPEDLPDLNEWLVADDALDADHDFAVDPPIDDDPSPRFRLMSERAASWAMRKLAQRKRDADIHRDTANHEIERIGNWLNKALEHTDRDIRFFEGLLIEWHAKNIEQTFGQNPLHGPVNREQWNKFRGKTRTLPTGDISARISSGTFEKGNVFAAAEFLEAFERTDLLAHKVEATPLQNALANPTAGVKLRDGYFYLRVATDEIKDMERAAVMWEQMNAAEPGNEGFTVVDHKEVCPNAIRIYADYPNSGIFVTMTQELGQHAQVETYMQIPGVWVNNENAVQFTVKPFAGEA